jgi:2,3-bisphosphoglycerate-dependent phosphoglycerate mutase
MAAGHKLVLVRHGQSEWNQSNRFTGWTDVELTEEGRQEAHRAGQRLKQANYRFDLAYTSCLKRAIKTLHIILDEMDQLWIPEYKDWKLNERHYGALESLNKSETAEKYGEEQVRRWRRSYETPPPPVTREDRRFPGNDPRYGHVAADRLPVGESLKDTKIRVVDYWQQVIAPQISQGKRVLIAAHGNSLRALVKHINKLNDQEIMEFEIPTGIPLIYELTEELELVRFYRLGDKE